MVDLCTRKIPNTMILCGWFAGLGFWLGRQGYRGGLYWLTGVLGALFAGAAVHLLGGIGAGDAKLLSAAGGILGLRRGLWLSVAALFLGGILGLAALWRTGEGGSALCRISRLIQGLLAGGKVVWPKGQGVKICYAVAVFGAALLLAVKEGGWILWTG